MHEHKTNTWKQHLDKINHKHNPHFLWGTIAKQYNKKPPTQQNGSIRFKTKTPITRYTKQKFLINNLRTSLNIAQIKSTDT